MAADDVPAGWTIQVDETSAGVYRLRAEDGRGRAVELAGVDPTALRADALRRIELLDAQTQEASAKAQASRRG